MDPRLLEDGDAAGGSCPPPLNQSCFEASERVADDDIATITSIDLAVHNTQARMLSWRHGSSTRAAIPPEVNAGSRWSTHSAEGSMIDSTMAEQSYDSSKARRQSAELDDQVADDERGGGRDVDYSDDSMWKQMQTCHELLEENKSLKQELREKDDKVSELEQALIQMKLELAALKSREDHHQLTMARSKVELAQAKEENDSLQQKLGIDNMVGQIKNTQLTKSFSNAKSPSNNIRSGEATKREKAPLTRSWPWSSRNLWGSLHWNSPEEADEAAAGGSHPHEDINSRLAHLSNITDISCEEDDVAAAEKENECIAECLGDSSELESVKQQPLSRISWHQQRAISMQDVTQTDTSHQQTQLQNDTFTKSLRRSSCGAEESLRGRNPSAGAKYLAFC